MAFLFYLLGMVLGIWPFKFQKYPLCGKASINRCLSTKAGRVEYAIWLPFLGWGSAWFAVGPPSFLGWRLVRIEFDSAIHSHFDRTELNSEKTIESRSFGNRID